MSKLWICFFVLGGIFILFYLKVSNLEIVSYPDTSSYLVVANNIKSFDWALIREGIRPLAYPFLLAIIQIFDLNYFSIVILLNYSGIALLFFGIKKNIDLLAAMLILYVSSFLFFSKINTVFERAYLTESICLFVLSLTLFVFLNIFFGKTKNRKELVEKIVGLVFLTIFLVQYKPLFLYAILPCLFGTFLFLTNKIIPNYKSVLLSLFICVGIWSINKFLLPKYSYLPSKYNLLGNYATLGIQKHFLSGDFKNVFSSKDIVTMKQIEICSGETIDPYECINSRIYDYGPVFGGLNHLTVSMLRADPLFILKVFSEKAVYDFNLNILYFGAINGDSGNLGLCRLFFVISSVSLLYLFIFFEKDEKNAIIFFIINMELLFLGLFLIPTVNLNENFGLSRVLLPSFIVYILVNSFIICLVINDVLTRLAVYINNNECKKKFV